MHTELVSIINTVRCNRFLILAGAKQGSPARIGMTTAFSVVAGKLCPTLVYPLKALKSKSFRNKGFWRYIPHAESGILLCLAYQISFV